MARTQINGGFAIKAATVTNSEIAAAAGIASTKLATWSANRDAGSNKLTSLASGTLSSDAINKGQLDAAIAALTSGGAKNARVATTGNITLSGVQTIDSVSGVADDVVFVRAQTAPAENGLYQQKAGAWVRTVNADAWVELVGSIIAVQEGATLHDTVWLITSDLGGTLGTTAVDSIQLPGPSDILAGAGLTRTGQSIDIVTADASMTIGANSIQVHLDAAGAITVTASGIGINVGAATGLQITSNALGIKLNGASLTLGASGLSVTTPTPTFITREVPSGSINGSNTAFTLANTPTAGSEQVYLDGILQQSGAGNDYTISGNAITYLTAPLTAQVLLVSYRF